MKAAEWGGAIGFLISGCAEQELIDCAKSGDLPSFEKLMTVHMKILYNYILFRVAQREDAKDILQEAMLSIWQSMPTFRRGSSFRTWTLAITKRKVADYYRAKYKSQTYAFDGQCDFPMEDDGLEHAENQAALAVAMRALTKQERDIVFLVFNAQLNYQQVSDLMEIPLGTVKSKMYAIKTKLRKALKEGDQNA